MIATITKDPDDPAQKPHIVQWTGQTGIIKVVTITYCTEEMSASVGIMQLPDKALDKGFLCPKCTDAYRAYEAQIR